MFRVGFGYRFPTERLDLMSGSCDVAPWSPIPLGGKGGSSARAAQGGGPPPSTCRPALPGMVLAVEGESAAPGVTVAGPGGGARPRRGRRGGRRARAARRRGAAHVRRDPGAAGRALDADARAGLAGRDRGSPWRRHPGAAGQGARDGPRPSPHAALDAPGDPRAGRPVRRGGPRERGRDRHDAQGARQQALRAGGRARRPAVDRRGRRAGRDGARPDRRRPLRGAGAAAPGEAEAAHAPPRGRRAPRCAGSAPPARATTACGPSSPTGAGCC